jgi:uncharacterized protein (UPF0305 family)
MSEDCVLIKKKEYDELKNKVQELEHAVKPDEINVALEYRNRYNDFIHIYDTMSIHGELRAQIRRIMSKFRREVVKKENELINNAMKEYFKLSYFERLKVKHRVLSDDE